MKEYQPPLTWVTFGFMLCLALSAAAQSPQEDDKVWKAFTAWIMTNPESVTLTAYAKKLETDGLSQENIQAQLETIRRLYKENPLKGVEVTYDRIFSKPLTGDPEKDGFTSTPSVFMMESVKTREPGTGLDVGAGQGPSQEFALVARGSEDRRGVEAPLVGDPVRPRLAGLLFLDVGDSGSAATFALRDLAVAAGWGLRLRFWWLGWLGLDVGLPLSHSPVEESFHLHASIGWTF